MWAAQVCSMIRHAPWLWAAQMRVAYLIHRWLDTQMAPPVALLLMILRWLSYFVHRWLDARMAPLVALLLIILRWLSYFVHRWLLMHVWFQRWLLLLIHRWLFRSAVNRRAWLPLLKTGQQPPSTPPLAQQAGCEQVRDPGHAWLIPLYRVLRRGCKLTRSVVLHFCSQQTALRHVRADERQRPTGWCNLPLFQIYCGLPTSDGSLKPIPSVCTSHIPYDPWDKADRGKTRPISWPLPSLWLRLGLGPGPAQGGPWPRPRLWPKLPNLDHSFALVCLDCAWVWARWTWTWWPTRTSLWWWILSRRLPKSESRAHREQVLAAKSHA